MIRITSRLLLFVLLLALISPASAQPQAAAAGTRLVVFEGFYLVT